MDSWEHKIIFKHIISFSHENKPVGVRTDVENKGRKNVDEIKFPPNP